MSGKTSENIKARDRRELARHAGQVERKRIQSSGMCWRCRIGKQPVRLHDHLKLWLCEGCSAAIGWLWPGHRQ